MKCLMQTQRGLSTVVATALMLTAVAVLGTTLVLWSNSNLRSYETSLAITSSDNMNRINEFLVVENVGFCKLTPPSGCLNGHNYINVTLANYGGIGLNITQIKLNDSRYVYKFGCGASSGCAAPVSLLPGKEFSWKNSTSYPFGSGKPQNVTITTGRGSIFTKQVTVP